ncbi:unnamed protein product, partial [marine sediment metagenome]
MKTVLLRYGKEQIKVNVPDTSEVLSGEKIARLADPAGEIRRRANSGL